MCVGEFVKKQIMTKGAYIYHLKRASERGDKHLREANDFLEKQTGKST